VERSAILERLTDGTLYGAQIDDRGPAGASRTYAEAVQGRIVVRGLSRAGESAREHPGGPGVVVLDDSLFALWVAPATLATRDGTPLTGIFPRSGHRIAFTARLDDSSASGRRAVRLRGDVEGTIWLDETGRLLRIEFPGTVVDVVRPAD
jgi:hypothetical protein